MHRLKSDAPTWLLPTFKLASKSLLRFSPRRHTSCVEAVLRNSTTPLFPWVLRNLPYGEGGLFSIYLLILAFECCIGYSRVTVGKPAIYYPQVILKASFGNVEHLDRCLSILLRTQHTSTKHSGRFAPNYYGSK